MKSYTAEGSSLEECFLESARILLAHLYKNKTGLLNKKTIHVKAKNRKLLLQGFLEKILYMAEVGYYIATIDSIKISGEPKTKGTSIYYQLVLTCDVRGSYSHTDSFHIHIKQVSMQEKEKKFIAGIEIIEK